VLPYDARRCRALVQVCCICYFENLFVCHHVLPYVAKCCRVFRVLQAVAEFYRVLLGVAECYRVLRGVAEC